MCEKQDLSLGRKVMKPCSELNPRVWQGDCFMGIDQKRSEMFQSWKAGGPLLGTDSVHYPDDIAARRRFGCVISEAATCAGPGSLYPARAG